MLDLACGLGGCKDSVESCGNFPSGLGRTRGRFYVFWPVCFLWVVGVSGCFFWIVFL